MRSALLVALGAALWSTDALFRHPLVQQLSPFTIVYFEHIFATLISFAYVMCSRDRKLFFMDSKSLGAAAFIGVFGSAIATVLFTMSFQLINPSVTILLQKVQPMFVILISFLFLGEKFKPGFFAWAAIALVAGFFVSFPTGIQNIDLHSANATGCFLALTAAILWAVSTTVGRLALHKAPASVLSFWRFFFGLIALFTFSRRIETMQIEIPFVPGQPGVMRDLFIMALIPGFLGVNLYYSGLKKIQASVATILELSFPICAIAVNYYFLNFQLSLIQLLASGILIVAMIGVSKSARRGPVD